MPRTSPTTLADFLWDFPRVRPISFMAYRMRLCTGFRPSLTSGSALPTMTLMA